MKVFFLGDIHHPNAQNWIRGLELYGGCEVTAWELPRPTGRLGKIKRLTTWATTLLSIRGRVRKAKPHVLIGYRITSYGFLAAWAGYKPLVIAAQGETDVWPMNHWTTPFKAWLAKYAIKRAALCQAWAEHMATSMLELGAKRENMLILPRGIDTSRFTFNEVPLAKGPVQMIVTRALYPEYRHDVILRAVAKLVKHLPHRAFKLVVVGDGIMREGLEQQAQELEIADHVEFTGRIPNAELPKLLESSHLYLSMPNTEGVSASLFEAMAAGCFPLVTDLTANQSFINNGENGFLITEGDYEMLFDRLCQVLASEALYKKGVQHNLNLVKRDGDLETNMKRFVARYREIMAG